ncbi:cell division protein FtsN [Thalassotalea euphylliae]|uniref:Cell division protein FtsN n=1 Tax=Thalassotalea euphylliae TaxID=1655234 RepID=A0A3E0TVZ5_9GAMM|nr:SPOR domain-containing protein [Thalassotalea euphylliae]REL28758.1 cell division protein FtsN [Thalassotalea euphylliae]
MAPQDYVSRSNNKKRSPYKKQQAEATGMPMKVKLITLFTILAVAGAGYFLWFLKDVKPIAHPVPKAPAVKATKKLPEPPAEKWEYIDKLKQGTQIEGGHYEVEEKGPYKMQCGSFRKRSQAEAMKAQIAFSGLVAKVSESAGKNGIWYKVALGPYPRKRLAEADKHKLKRNNITTCQIWLWN